MPILQSHKLRLVPCTYTTSCSSSLVSGEGLMRMYDSLFPWSVIPSDTGRKEVSEAGNKIGTGCTTSCATSTHTEQRLFCSESQVRKTNVYINRLR